MDDPKAVDADASALLAGQLLLGYVSATELYLRRTIARMVKVCPQIRASNSSQTIQFGAVDYYGKTGIEYALTEQVSFTEPGKIKSQLNARLGVAVGGGTSLERSISEFERLCQLRHALVHSHGVLSSANASLLLGASGTKAYQTRLDRDSLEWAAVVAVNLVRDVNLEVVRSTLWKWLTDGYLTPRKRVNRPRVDRLLSAIASETDRKSKLATFDTDTLTDLVTTVASEMGARRRSA
ncbi:hypothetical protein SFC79_17065 [Nocardioides sp. S-58]|uniref:Apea-like HEPN domain-containing protein n=1 Tax=Nocardioides renjunii TaxID=3095075 RepID=A0ABU5KF75_9ACTN|nr:hypothetical protein [Nocardioides sp. S-58]MDZ5663487.1 hypothetical protein [Nocardioides sp. S-58]